MGIGTIRSSREYNHEGIDPPQIAFAGKLIYDAMFWSPVPNDADWCTSIDKNYGYFMIRLKQLLQTRLIMIRINERNKLPTIYNKNMLPV